MAGEIARDSHPQAPDPLPGPTPQYQVESDTAAIPRMKGKSEQLAGGGVRTWISDLCYLESNPLRLNPLKGGFGRESVRVCKVRNLGERQSEARAEAIAESIRKKRATQIREMAPEATGSGVQVP